jgi:hypothetical protein
MKHLTGKVVAALLSNSTARKRHVLVFLVARVCFDNSALPALAASVVLVCSMAM